MTEESSVERRHGDDDVQKLRADARDEEADARDAIANERSANADMRELIVDARGDEADSREVTADAREAKADARGITADSREVRADARESAADMRDLIGDARGVKADFREVSADVREAKADAREAAAEARDSAADARDATSAVTSAMSWRPSVRNASAAGEAGDGEEVDAGISAEFLDAFQALTADERFADRVLLLERDPSHGGAQCRIQVETGNDPATIGQLEEFASAHGFESGTALRAGFGHVIWLYH